MRDPLLGLLRDITSISPWAVYVGGFILATRVLGEAGGGGREARRFGLVEDAYHTPTPPWLVGVAATGVLLLARRRLVAS